MKTRAGIWLDAEKSFIVFLNNGNARVEMIESGIETRVRFEGERKPFSRLGGMLYNPAKKRTERKKHRLKDYFETLKTMLQPAGEIYVFGPAGTGKQFSRHMYSCRQMRDRVVKVERTDRMTEKQMVAKVKDFFTEREKETERKGRA